MNIMNYITYGLYVLSVREGDKDSGCMINTLLQQTSQPTLCCNRRRSLSR